MTLVNSESALKLAFRGGLFVANGADKESLKKAAKENGGFVRKFGVHISTFNPKTEQVIKWKMTKGFSLWKPLQRD